MRKRAPVREPFRSILCPVDFSPHARTALRYAAAVAGRSGGRLTAIFVNDPLLVAAAAAAAYDLEALASSAQRRLRDFVAGVVARREAGVESVACTVVQGDPAREIQKAARRLSVDLVVMGTRGLTGARRLFLGSTAERMLRGTTVPILTVPEAVRSRRLAGRWPGRAVAAVDLHPRSAADVRRAAHVARVWGADLLLAHVVSPAPIPGWLRARLGHRQRALVASARARLERIVDRTGVTASCRVLLGDPAAQITALATDTDADLLVVTLRGTPGLLGSPQGTVTYRILALAGAPVLALPEAWP